MPLVAILSMKKILSFLLPAAQKEAPQKVETLNPASILFSIPTLSDDLAALEPVTQAPDSSQLLFHEDEWCQTEFFSSSRLNEIQNMLSELARFEAENREQSGWRNTYIRKLQRNPVIAGEQALAQLESWLGIQATVGPLLFAATSISGRVKDGFTLPLGGNISLYGYTNKPSIPVLGAYIGDAPDHAVLTEAFVHLNQQAGLILVDWRSQLILVGVSAEGQIETWRP